ncbi:MAG: hypothetical protein ABSB63_21395 [Spirochaetia bacterium]|jgi:hypothetical protein
MENEGPKRVSAIKPDREILGYPYGFNCYGGSSGKRERDVKDAIDRCRIDPNSIFQTSVLDGFPGAAENFLSVRGRREGDLKEVRAMLLSGDFGYSEA